MKHIQSRDNPQFKQLRKLATSSKERRDTSSTLIDGLHLFRSALDARHRPSLAIVAERALHHPDVAALLAEHGDAVLLLADGLFEHRERPAPGSFFETDIKLPNINCEKCTLQVLQFMEEHGLNREGDFSYHHCADLKITANPALPIDKAWPGQ